MYRRSPFDPFEIRQDRTRTRQITQGRATASRPGARRAVAQEQGRHRKADQKGSGNAQSV